MGTSVIQRFDRCLISPPPRWLDRVIARREVKSTIHSVMLFISRNGGPVGPRCRLIDQNRAVSWAIVVSSAGSSATVARRAGRVGGGHGEAIGFVGHSMF